MSIKTIYLILYNLLQFFGWSLFFNKISILLIKQKSIQEIYNESHYILEYCQYGASLEIVHSILKLVNSNIIATSVQILGRIAIVAILQFFRSSVSFGYLFLYFAWSLVEIIRYSYYIVNLIKKEYNTFNVSYIHIWCRYSFFIVLYPIGVTGEIITVLNARKDLEKYKLGSKYSYADLVYPIFVLYIPSLIFLYSHLFKQRNKELKKLNKDKSIKNE